jgi:hypothetical protein
VAGRLPHPATIETPPEIRVPATAKVSNAFMRVGLKPPGSSRQVQNAEKAAHANKGVLVYHARHITAATATPLLRPSLTAICSGAMAMDLTPSQCVITAGVIPWDNLSENGANTMAQGINHFSWEPRELDTFFSGNKPKIISTQNWPNQTENRETKSDAALSYMMSRSMALKTSLFFW